MSISIPQADFTPQLAGYTGQGAFRFWCQKVLPIVYDDSLSYYELLNKVVVYLNNVISDVATVEENVGELSDAYVNLQNYVNEHTQEIAEIVNQLTDYINNYFDNLDIQNEINTKLDKMAEDGSLSDILEPFILREAPGVITAWLEENITPTSPPVDDTLTIKNAAADAYATGEAIRYLETAMGAEIKKISYQHVEGYYPSNGVEMFDMQNSFKAGSVINKIVAKNDSAVSPYTLNVSLWKEEGELIVRYKTITLNGNSDGLNIEFDLNEKLAFDSYVSFASECLLSTAISHQGLVEIHQGTNSFNKNYPDSYGINYQFIMDIHYTEIEPNEKIDNVVELLGIKNSTLEYNHVSGYYPTNGDEFLDIRSYFNAGCIIKRVVVKNDSISTPSTLTISFWRESGDSVVRYKTLTLTGEYDGTDVVFNLNEKISVKTYVSYQDVDLLSTQITERALLAIADGINSVAKNDFNTRSIAYQFLMEVGYIDSDIYEDIDTLKNLIGVENRSINYAAVDGVYPVSPDEFFDCQTVLEAGSIINRFRVVNTNVTTPNQLKVSFWHTVGTNMVRYDSLTLDGYIKGGQIIFDTNYQVRYTSYVSFEDPDLLSTHINAIGLLQVSANADVFNKSLIDTQGIGYQLIMGVDYTVFTDKNADIIVNVGEGKDYEEIQDALDATGNADITIILHPRCYPYKRFSTIRKLNESYPWNGLAKVRNISIIGLDLAKCVVQDDSGNYDTPPAEIACNGVVKNIQFIATHDASTLVANSVPSYAVHIDNRPLDSSGMNLEFENCKFTSYQTSAVGIGVYRNQTVCFKDCEFYNKTPQGFTPYTGYNQYYNHLGAIIMHTSMGFASGNDKFKLINNLLITDHNANAITLRETETEGTCTLEFINNTLWNLEDEDGIVNWEGPGTFRFEPYNRLNNNAGLNSI